MFRFSETGSGSAEKILLIQVGTPPAEVTAEQGDLAVWFSTLLKQWSNRIEVIRLYEDEELPEPDLGKLAVITGSWSMVTDKEPWSERGAAWIRDAVLLGMPLFGVCYGHQLIAYALGGTVGWNPKGREVGCQTISLTSSGLLSLQPEGWPSEFPAHLTHMQTIISLPPGAVTLARSANDNHQIVRYARNVFSTQFHPEFTPEIARTIIRYRQNLLIREGEDPQELIRQLTDTPEASGLLIQFVHENMKPSQIKKLLNKNAVSTVVVIEELPTDNQVLTEKLPLSGGITAISGPRIKGITL